MSFRQAKTETPRASQEWQGWVTRCRPELLAIGLPAEVLLDAARWSDFLENGQLHWHASSGFEFGQLGPGQLAALHRFLEREYGQAGRCPPLLGWVRVRVGAA